VNLLQLEPDEKITGAIPVKSFESGFIVLVTRSGNIVKNATAGNFAILARGA